MLACAAHRRPPDIPLTDPVEAHRVSEPPAPMKIVEMPQALALPGQLKPIDREADYASKPSAAPTVSVMTANRLARIEPSRDGYVNATQVWPYSAGALYQVYGSPGRVTDIALENTEELISISAGDTVRWVLGETVQGTGDSQQVIVFVKPVRGSLRTNIILTTDQRTYLLDAVSHDGDTYTSVIAWNYPQEQMREAEAARAAATQSVVSETTVDHLNFGYSVKALNTRHPPRWQPLRVFDDGLKTYIQFPPDLASTDAPPLFLIGPKDQAQLVNYRLVGGYYIVDRLIEVAELRLGENPQMVVRITRTGRAG